MNEIQAKIVQRESKKGNIYVAIELTFPNGYTKLVFLDKAEEYMALAYL